ncbi:MAG TPA: hypothetical protein VGD99_25615 [Anaerolineae bacterium]
MSSTLTPIIPKLRYLPAALPLEGAVRIELQQGIPIFKASYSVQERVETLLQQQQSAPLSRAEAEELDRYEEMDDYLSFVNRTIRNLIEQNQT